MDQFKTVALDDQEILSKYLKESGNYSCDFSLGYNYIWNWEERLSYRLFEETLVFRYITQDASIYRISGYSPGFLRIIKEILEDWAETEKELRLTVLNEKMVQQLEEAFPGAFCIRQDRANWDYVYEVQDLINLSGKKYHGKRNHLNKFTKAHHFIYEVITRENIPECVDMARTWLDSREQTPELLQERRALRLAFQMFEKLGLSGALIRVEGRVSAFTVGEPLNQEIYVTHFEKALDHLPGLYPLINQQFAKNHLFTYRYVNREEDMGLEGLRKAKLSYYPAFLVEKYTAGFGKQRKKE